MEVKNRYVTIKHAVDGRPEVSDFELGESPLVLSVGENSDKIIVKNLYLSIDPYQLNRMKSYSPSHSGGSGNWSPIIPGQVIDAGGVGRVVSSGDPEYQEGDVVTGLLAWEDYSTISAARISTKLRPGEPSSGLPLSHHVSVLGSSGLTAYSGFYSVCKPKRGETVFVSAAMGSVGSIVGQLAKLHRCYVVGSAGSKLKVKILKEELGFDEAFNYKEEDDLRSALKRYFPDGIDIYFDHVGGEMLEAALANMRPFGRVAACGAISQYTSTGGKPALDMVSIIYKRIRIEGFLVADYMHELPECVETMSGHVRGGRVQVLEDISEGIESIPVAFRQLFEGENIGKKVVKLVE